MSYGGGCNMAWVAWMVATLFESSHVHWNAVIAQRSLPGLLGLSSSLLQSLTYAAAIKKL